MVSIIIPTYNTAHMIGRCLESVLGQSYKDIEVLVVDDGSSDDTARVVGQYADRDQRVKYIFQNNQGVSAARNTGIDNSKGEYIIFSDADDEYLPDSICTLVYAMKEQDADIVIGSIQKVFSSRVLNCVPLFDEKCRVYRDAELEKLRRWNIERNPSQLIELPCTDENGSDRENAFRLGSPWGRVYKRSCIGDCRFNPDLFLSEDLIFNNIILDRANSVLIIKELVYAYHIESESASNRKYSKTAAIGYLSLAKEFNKIKGKYDSAYFKTVEKKIMLCCWAGIKKGIVSNENSTLIQKIKEIKRYISNEPYSSCIEDLTCADCKRLADKLKTLILKKRIYILLLLIHRG